jgi:hypothetical protein
MASWAVYGLWLLVCVRCCPLSAAYSLCAGGALGDECGHLAFSRRELGRLACVRT